MNLKNLAAILLACAFISLQSCKKETVDQPNNNSNIDKGLDIPSTYFKIGETYFPGQSVKAVIYGESAPIVGFNNIQVALYDSAGGSRIKTGTIRVTPMMNMGTMVHSAPYENSKETAPASQLWKSSIVFIMPGMWELKFKYINSQNDTSSSSIQFQVNSPTSPLMKNILLAKDDSAKVFISLVSPVKAKIGLNPFELAIHRKKDMMNFPGEDGYTIEIRPEMPSMGHGSPNNENPVLIGNGHYLGKVNFTMSGLWRVYLTIKKNGEVLDDTQYFDITF